MAQRGPRMERRGVVKALLGRRVDPAAVVQRVQVAPLVVLERRNVDVDPRRRVQVEELHVVDAPVPHEPDVLEPLVRRLVKAVQPVVVQVADVRGIGRKEHEVCGCRIREGGVRGDHRLVQVLFDCKGVDESVLGLARRAPRKPARHPLGVELGDPPGKPRVRPPPARVEQRADVRVSLHHVDEARCIGPRHKVVLVEVPHADLFARFRDDRIAVRGKLAPEHRYVVRRPFPADQDQVYDQRPFKDDVRIGGDHVGAGMPVPVLAAAASAGGLRQNLAAGGGRGGPRGVARGRAAAAAAANGGLEPERRDDRLHVPDRPAVAGRPPYRPVHSAPRRHGHLADGDLAVVDGCAKAQGRRLHPADDGQL